MPNMANTLTKAQHQSAGERERERERERDREKEREREREGGRDTWCSSRNSGEIVQGASSSTSST
jgi:hypothetical protein